MRALIGGITMSKIICEICGTTYQETADCCPICGCARGAAEDLLNEDVLAEEAVEETAEKSIGLLKIQSSK